MEPNDTTTPEPITSELDDVEAHGLKEVAAGIGAAAVLGGVAVGALITIGIYGFAVPRMPGWPSEGEIAMWKRVLASIYGGIDEELLMRLFLFALALWLAVSPWVLGYAHVDAATANAAIAGLALALAAHFEASCDELACEWLNVTGGVWLMVAPFVLGFSGEAPAAVNSILVGGLVCALAVSALSLDKQLARLWHKPPA